MNWGLKFLLFFSFFLACGQARSDSTDFNPYQVRYVCSQNNNGCRTSFKAQPQPLQVLATACEAHVKSPVCQEYFKTDAYLATHARSCDVDTMCEESKTQNNLESLNICLQGYLAGTGEIVDAIKTWAENVKIDIEKQSEYISSCNESVDCKRELVTGIPKYETLNDKDLNKFTAAFLLVEKQNAQYMQSVQQRNEHKDTSPMGVAQGPPGVGSDRAKEINLRSLYHATNKWFEKKQAQLQCLDAATQTEMMCWGAAYIIDPLIVVGVAVKGGKIASAVQKLAKESASAAKTGLRETMLKAPTGSGVAAKTGLRESVDNAEARALMQEIKKMDISRCSLRGACESRAHKIAMMLEEKGIESQKIFAVNNMDNVTITLNKTSTMTNSALGTRWNYHVANLIKVTDETGAVVEKVIDPALFPGPVDRAVWERKMNTGEIAVDFKVADKTTLEPINIKKPPYAWTEKDLAKVEDQLKGMSSYQEVYKGRQTILKARWIDKLQVVDHEKFLKLSEALLNPEFKKWWNQPKLASDYKAEIIEPGSRGKQYVSPERVREIMQRAPTGRVDAQIKVETWEEVWRQIQAGNK